MSEHFLHRSLWKDANAGEWAERCYRHEIKPIKAFISIWVLDVLLNSSHVNDLQTPADARDLILETHTVVTPGVIYYN